MLDQFDRSLLRLLQENADLTSEQLTEWLPLSQSAIQRRLKRLRDAGVIERTIAVIAPGKVGRPNTFVVSIQVERETPDRQRAFRAWLVAQDCIQQVFYVTGDTDYILIVNALDTETYDQFMSELVGKNPNVKRFTTHVALAIIKRGLSLALPEGEPVEADRIPSN